MTSSASRGRHASLRLLATLLGLLALVWPLAPALADSTLPAPRYSELKYLDGTHALLLTINTDTPATGVDLEHNLRLLDAKGEQLAYDEVVFEVLVQGKQSDLTLRGDNLLHEETLPMLSTRDSKVSFNYPLSGPYTIVLTFRADDKDIARGQFGMEVEQGTSSSASDGFPWIRFVLTLLLGVLIGALLPRGTRSEAPAEGRSTESVTESESTNV